MRKARETLSSLPLESVDKILGALLLGTMGLSLASFREEDDCGGTRRRSRPLSNFRVALITMPFGSNSAVIRSSSCPPKASLQGLIHDKGEAPASRSVLESTPKLAAFYGAARCTAIDWEQRTRGKPLALWLNHFYASGQTGGTMPVAERQRPP